MQSTEIRRYHTDDATACAEIFYMAVQQTAASDYSEAERQAWAPQPPDSLWLGTRLNEQLTWVAEDDREVVGFASYRTDGYFDLLYVHPQYAGKGVAKRLYDEVVAHAAANGCTDMSTHASHLARRFFTRQGWEYVAPNAVEREGVTLTNHIMRLTLAG